VQLSDRPVGAAPFRVLAVGALGIGLAVLTAPLAVADPAPVDPLVPVPAAPDPLVDAVAAPAPVSVTPPDGVSHLPSPDSLPPGTTQEAPQYPKLEYLRDIWNSIRGEDVSASDALLLLAQRPVDNSRLAESVPARQVAPVAPPPAEVPVPVDAPAAAPAAGAAPVLPPPPA
jgi:hypothetical protein